jgi:5-methyltetrahydropteroyltriglutamate--homocysteine methyltransferase
VTNPLEDHVSTSSQPVTANYRADQVGSLLRPQELLELRQKVQEGTVSSDELRAREDEAIRDALAHQARTGIGVFVDGEFRRSGFMTGFMEAVRGFREGKPAPLPWHGGSGSEPESANARLVVDKVVATSRIAEDEAAFLRANAPGPFKVTLPSPVNFALSGWRQDVSSDAYPTPSDFVADAADILADEVSKLVDEGLPYIQLDAPSYTHWADDSLKSGYEQMGFHLDTFLDDCISSENAVFAQVPDDVTTGIHLCRGNSAGRWLAEGSYDALAEKLFSELKCERLLLEYDSDRAGGFEPLRFVTEDKTVVLGLVTTKSGELEQRDDLLKRIEEATAFVPIERLAISPQCGFASSGFGNPLTMDEQWRKLELIASVASEVWGEAPA